MWWAAQVANNKEYDTKREIVNGHMLEDDKVFIPRMRTYEMHEDSLEKKTETMIPGYILLDLGEKAEPVWLESLSNYIKIIGPVTDSEMENIKKHENILKNPDVHKGNKIIVTRGPFTGVKGSIIGVHDVEKYQCKLIFHGNEIEVDLDAEIIEKIS